MSKANIIDIAKQIESQANEMLVQVRATRTTAQDSLKKVRKRENDLRDAQRREIEEQKLQAQLRAAAEAANAAFVPDTETAPDRKSTRLNSSHT